MSICRKCGVENATSAKFCQMCASPLPVADAGGANLAAGNSHHSLSTTVVFRAETPEAQTCTVCEAVNEAEWTFCQQCGSKLGRSPDPALDSEVAAPNEQRAYATTIHVSRPLDKPNKASGAGHVTCTKCSQLVVEGAAFCQKCGAAITSARTMVMASVRPSLKGRLVLIVDGEATGDEYELKGDTVIGRTNGDITFPHDDYMSGCHARIAKRGDKFMLIDEDSRNGSFVRIKKEVEIGPGDFILLGKQLFRFEV